LRKHFLVVDIEGYLPYNLREITGMSVQPLTLGLVSTSHLCVLEGGLPYNVREITAMSV
jgi:hypothetical protein